MAGALQPQFARGVAGQQPLGQDAVFDDIATLRAHAFAVERRGGQPFQQVRMLFNGQPFRQDLRAQRVEQEGRLTVYRPTGNGAHQMPEQPGRHFIGKDHRCFHGRQFSWSEAGQCAFCALHPNPLRRLKIAQRAANGVGVIALHVAILFGDDAAGERVTGGAVALQHTVAVAKNFDAVVAVKAAAFGVGDALIGVKGGLFRASRELNGFVRGHFCRVEQIQIRGLKSQQFAVCDACVRIRRGVGGDIQRRLHGTRYGVRAEVGGGGTAFTVLVINSNP